MAHQNAPKARHYLVFKVFLWLLVDTNLWMNTRQDKKLLILGTWKRRLDICSMKRLNVWC